ncbi:hypothetical protein AB0L54_34180 [Streptomyces sp. NPDC052196]|uniref:hypothetical protein n=1 Tax=Streptomyces sp. NPDC052196 TaxID=3156691 RepID=UPI0034222581
MTPADDPCKLLQGPAGDYCRGGSTGHAGPSISPDNTDPLTGFAHSMANGAAWVCEGLAKTIGDSSAVDFTSGPFVARYAITFAAASVLALTLWLIAVAKRAMRGVPLTTAVGEAVGFLWLVVIASAFTPLVLHVVVTAVDAVTDAMTGTTGGTAQMFTSMATSLRQGGQNIGGGPLMLLLTSGLTIVLAGLLWLELALRAVTLYVGAVLGTVVYAGLVDRDLWGKVKNWAAMMIALIMIRPVIAIALGISSVFTGSQGAGKSVIGAGIVVIILALSSGVAIFRFVPGYGNDIAAGLSMRAGLTGARAAKIGVRAGASAAGVVAQGIRAHGTRSGESGQSAGGQRSKASGSANGVTEGIQAHGTRSKKDKPGK